MEQGGVMHAKRVLFLDYDLGSLALLLIGTGAAALLALSGF
jgi:hypothetical protein